MLSDSKNLIASTSLFWKKVLDSISFEGLSLFAGVVLSSRCVEQDQYKKYLKLVNL